MDIIITFLVEIRFADESLKIKTKHVYMSKPKTYNNGNKNIINR